MAPTSVLRVMESTYSVNETLGVSLYQAIFGKITVGPLQLLCDEQKGGRPPPFDLAKEPIDYLTQLETVNVYMDEHAARQQERYTHA